MSLVPCAALRLALRAALLPGVLGMLALTGHGVEAQHAAHEVGETNPAAGIAVAQHQQAQQLRVGGQTCRRKTHWDGKDQF